MSQAPIMPFFTDAYLADCHHLSTEAHGAYLLILLHTWRLGGKPLPDDDRILQRIVKARSLQKWRQLKTELLPFFDCSDGHWRQKKLERTWADVSRKVEQNRDNGSRGRAIQLGKDKALKSQQPARADATATSSQSINHEPDPKPTNLKEDDMIIEMTPYPSKGALESLTPILRDSKYFLHNGGYRASPSLRPQIEQAIEEIDAQLAPAPVERIRQIVTRLMLHFPAPSGEQKHRICADYTAMLQDYPEDMLCAAYQHVLKHHKYNSMPKIADLMAFIEPEIARRRTVRRKLGILFQQTSEEVVA